MEEHNATSTIDSAMSNESSSTLHKGPNNTEVEAISPVIANRIYPDATPPSQAQIDIIRLTWERVSEIQLPTDPQNVSPTHAFGLAFYDALFEIDPSLKPLFSDIFLQARALAGMIAYIARTPKVIGTKCPFSGNKTSQMTNNEDKEIGIREINAMKKREYATEDFQSLVTFASQSESQEDSDMKALLYKLREVGARHYFYSVKPEHLALVGPAVLKALKARLNKEFLPEVADAWTRV